MNPVDTFLFSISATLPILLWMVAGMALRRLGHISNAFLQDANRLIFNWFLPTLLFLNVARSPLTEVWQGDLILFGTLFTLAAILFMWWLTPFITSDRTVRGVFVQGAYRGNMGIGGLALVVNAYGAEAVPLASVYLAVLTLVYNITGVLVLQFGQVRFEPLKMLGQMLGNPIMIGVFLGIAWSLLQLPLPELAENTLQGLANISLPLALLCVGAGLRLASLHSNRRLVLWVSAFKLAILPAIAMLAAILLGFRGMPLGVLFLMLSAPTAAVSYVMAKAMTPWGELAGEIIVVTTLLSLVTTTLGLFVLRAFGLI